MNKKIDFKKLVEFYEKNRANIPYLLVGLVALVLMILTFFALYPFTDKSLIQAGKDRVLDLQINFDQKIIKELENKQNPTQITGTGGRDPFTRL